MHQILLLLLCVFVAYVAKLLNTYEKKYCFQVGFLTKTLDQFRFKVPPPHLQVVIHLHRAKIGNAYLCAHVTDQLHQAKQGGRNHTFEG